MPRGRLLPIHTSLSVCLRCQLSQRRRDFGLLRSKHMRQVSSSTKSVSTPGFFPPSSISKQPAYAHLENRSVIRLHGPDVVDFLNGLLPAKLQSSLKDTTTPIFTTFLSAKGRILYESFIYPPSNPDDKSSWYIDVDTRSLPALFSHLKKHKLRSKFKLEKVPPEELGVFYIWPGQEHPDIKEIGIGGQDPRPLMGKRFLSNISNPSTLSTVKEIGSALSVVDYEIHRMLSGHAEGPDELISGSALPQESNVDFVGGIDFHKGCYLGQELTIRTHHTGVVRKRILPCQLYMGDESLSEQQVPIYDSSSPVHQPPCEANLSKMHAKGRSGRSTGKWLKGVGNVGLALCRLEMMTDIQLTAEGMTFDPSSDFSVVWEEGEADNDGKSTLREAKVKPFVPQWLRESIEAGIKARSDRSKKRKQEDVEDDDVD